MYDWLIKLLKNGDIDSTVQGLTGISDDDYDKLKNEIIKF